MSKTEAAGLIARAINDTSNAAAKYEQLRRKNEYRVQVVLVIFTILATLGALAAAIGAWYSLPQVKKSADAAKQSADIAASTLQESQRQVKLASAERKEGLAERYLGCKQNLEEPVKDRSGYLFVAEAVETR